MKKIFTYDKYNFNLYDVTTSIIFNDERAKKKILNVLPLDDYTFIDSKVTYYNISIKEYLSLFGFKMNLVPFFNLHHILNKKISTLDLPTIIYIKIISMLCSSKSIVIFDDVLSFLSDEQKNKIIEYINMKKVRFINVTSDIEDTLYSEYLIVLTNSGVAIEGNTKDVLNEEKILKRLGFNLPFVVDLSIQLQSYEVIDKVYYDLDGLVSELWK